MPVTLTLTRRIFLQLRFMLMYYIPTNIVIIPSYFSSVRIIVLKNNQIRIVFRVNGADSPTRWTLVVGTQYR